VLCGNSVQHYQNKSSVWVTDIGSFTVKQFDATSGQLLAELGTPDSAGNGTAPFQFDQVADLAFGDDG
jgi:hypothetical protein